jgi:hypothetical protein
MIRGMGTSPTVEGPAIRQRGAAMAELRRRERRRELRRERQEFGGRIQWEAVFFGLLAAIGLAASLSALVLGALVAAGVASFDDDAASFLGRLVTGGGAVAIAILALGYLTGGYVAARMARFDGWRQGLGIWVLSLLIAAAVAIAAWVGGGELDPTNSISLPGNPVDQGPLSQSGWVILAVAVLVPLIFATLGGVLGERFHRAVDRVGYEDEEAEAVDEDEETEATSEADDPDEDLGNEEETEVADQPYGPRRVRHDAPASAASSSEDSTASPAANP